MIFQNWKLVEERYYQIDANVLESNQELTNFAFSEKWNSYNNENANEIEKWFDLQKNWFLKNYGFDDEVQLSKHLRNLELILDAGCGIGYKTAWFASLAPESTVVGIDYSSSAYIGYKKYREKFENLIFAQGDIPSTKINNEQVGFVVCDQVIMHTEDPLKTLKELSRITSSEGEICCYWYKKKALPREILDGYFRKSANKLTNDELWQLSKEVLTLGKMLSELNINADFPDVPSLGIKGGKMDLQRFIYWNFLKCFWNEDLGYSTSLSTNFDWYSPVNAKRFSKDEVDKDVNECMLKEIYFNQEEASFSGRYTKSKQLSVD